MKIVYISSEVFPFAKTGGLGDVAGVLPKYLEAAGCEVKVFMPKYFSIDEDKYDLKYCWDIGDIPVRVDGHIRSVHLHQAKLPNSNVEVNFIDCPHYFNRHSIYTNDHDEDERFILFCKGILEVLQRFKWKPDVIHCNDWTSGLMPLFIKDNYSWDKLFHNVATVFTIHNIGYQGRFSTSTLLKAELKSSYYFPGGPVEYKNTVSFMKAALTYSDIITTVSETYAKEILSPEYGAGMEGILLKRKNDLYGILNGVDYNIWNPEIDKFLPYKYSIDDLSGKLKNKRFLLEHFNLPFDNNVPLFAIISRLVNQKGFDILVQTAESLMNYNAQWIILGNGEDYYEDFFIYLAQRYPKKTASYIGFNNELSHLIEAGSDFLLMPSKYEPCGLNQIYSLKYGTIPVVRKTGGLADTVNDWDEYKSKGDETGTGLSYEDYSGGALFKTVDRAFHIFQNKDVYNRIQKNGMQQNFSWEKAAGQYIDIYKKAIKKVK